MKLCISQASYIVCVQVTGEWMGRSAGGCSNFGETYLNNPVYQLRIDSVGSEHHVMIELRGPKSVPTATSHN